MRKDLNRRDFITFASATGAALLSSCSPGTNQSLLPATPSPGARAIVPKRPFGNTGANVSSLCLGGSSVMGADTRALLDAALALGIDCWEFNPFTGRAFGDYFKVHPGVRQRVFLTAKARSTDPTVLQADLEKALADNETSVVDFFAVHGVDDVNVLTDDVRRWAEGAKERGSIRFFGFCSHKRMDSCLDNAAKLSWIDGVQVFYNYRMQVAGNMEVPLRKCHENGIGVFVVKSMGLCIEDEGKLTAVAVPKHELMTRLARHELSFEHAKLRSIWQNAHLTSVCSLMPNLDIMHANARAAMDPRPLNGDITKLLSDYADDTGRYFCRRCGTCDSAAPHKIPVFNVMEALMYARAYGSRELAMRIFAAIPSELRSQMIDSDYTEAERSCPQRIRIAESVKDACRELSG